MKTIFLCVFTFSVVTSPAFADDVNVKPSLLPNETLVLQKQVTACVVRQDQTVAACGPTTMHFDQGVSQTPFQLLNGAPSVLDVPAASVKHVMALPTPGKSTTSLRAAER